VYIEDNDKAPYPSLITPNYIEPPLTTCFISNLYTDFLDDSASDISV